MNECQLPDAPDVDADNPDDEDPNPPYDPPAGHTWTSWTT